MRLMSVHSANLLSASRAVRTVVAALAVATLAACATAPTSIAPGTPEADAVTRLGPPVARHALPDGSTNLEYSTAPMGQYAWMVNVRDGTVRTVTQVLSIEEFAKVRIGRDTQADIRARFGRTTEEAHLTLARRDVWSYRMKQDNIWPIWMNVQFDDAGIVREVFPTPDPSAQGGGDRGGKD